MAIMQPKTNGGPLNSKALKIGLGFAMGGPIGAAAAAAGDSPMGRALGMFNSAGGGGAAKPGAAPAPEMPAPMPAPAAPQMMAPRPAPAIAAGPADVSDALSRRLYRQYGN